jgi:hypothetical protein
MKSKTFSAEQIAAREKVWRAARDGEAVELSVQEAKDLWSSILATGVELAQLRDRVKQGTDEAA